MTTAVTCPSCHTEIEITEVMRSQLTEEIRNEMEAGVRSKKRELDVLAKSLDEQQRKVESAQTEIDDRIRAGVAAEKKQLLDDAVRKAREDLAVELQDRDERVTELESKLKESRTLELSLRKRERELESKTEELKLQVARELDSERDKIRIEARVQFEEQHQLKDAEKEKQIADLRKQIDDLKRKAEQGSQQMQGEVQELALEDLLGSSFPTDTIEPVAKGVHGGDAVQRVIDPTGLNCGGILWESKRTKNWSNGWLAKARDDQRSARAGCVVIVSEALPDGIRTFGLVEGVWVCSWSCVTGLAAALRAGIIEVGKSKLAVQGQHEKMELVYNYLSGREFQQRIEGVAEAFITMQSDLDSEKRSVQRLWSKREKQLQRALANTAGLYGDLQGIIGASLPTVEGLTIAAIDSDEADAPKLISA